MFENHDEFKLNTKLFDHIKKIILDHTVNVTGNTDHLTVKTIVNMINTFKGDEESYEYKRIDHSIKLFYDISLIPSKIITPQNLEMDDLEPLVEKVLKGEESMTIDSRGFNPCACYDCGECIYLTIEGNKLLFSTEKDCESNMEFDVEYDFPTGEVVFDDWPKYFTQFTDAGFIPKDEDDMDTLKSLRGITQFNADSCNIVHHFVGNTCPGMYVRDDLNGFCVGNEMEWDWETDDEPDTSVEGYKESGSFCTDLWWITMIDKKYYDIMRNAMPELKDDGRDESDIIKINPGRYRITFRARTDGMVGHFAKAERIGECLNNIEPSIDPLHNKRIMDFDEVFADALNKLKIVYANDLERLKFWTVKNFVTNIRSFADFVEAYAVDKDTPKATFPELVAGDNPNKQSIARLVDTGYVYSHYLTGLTVLGIKSEFMTESWLKAIKWYYEKQIEVVNDDVESVHVFQHPDHRKGSKEQTIKHVKEVVEQDNLSNADVSARWDIEFTGNWDELPYLIWERTKRKFIVMCEEYLNMVDERLKELEEGA